MKTVKVEGWIVMPPSGDYMFSTVSMKDQPGWIDVTEVEFDAEIPDNFDPVKAQVDSLRKAAEEIKKESAAKITAIETRIANLLCIENNPSEVAA